MRLMSLGAAVFAAGIATFGSPVMTANAAVIVTVQEIGQNVVFESTGSLDITGLTPIGQQTTVGLVRGTELFVFQTAGVNATVDAYLATSVPTNFGGSRISAPDSVVATSPPDSAFGALIGPPVIRLPLGYTSGTPLIFEMAFIDESLVSLELTPGTYVWTLENDDTVTLRIDDPFEVTAPPTLPLLGAAVIGLGLVARRRRQALAH
ncbi:MAG: hypothetical protein MI806_12550 [Minwuiales bacterium]|nr:hypothetical protein [Minwuiales bacterium]